MSRHARSSKGDAAGWTGPLGWLMKRSTVSQMGNLSIQ